MARRNLSPKEIRDGMKLIHDLFNKEKKSAREVAKKKLPFSLTTYYKYLPKYEKSLTKKQTPETIVEAAKYDDDLTPTKVVARNKERDLVEENHALQDEINRLSRFIVKNMINDREVNLHENGSSDQGIH